jgi:hypothetical protein
MSTNKTENYQLHSWEAGDDFLRTEMNENFSLLDSNLAGKAGVVTGTYTGTYEGSDTPELADQFIDLGFTPKAVLVMPETGSMSGYYGGLALQDTPVLVRYINSVEIGEDGFTVRSLLNVASANDAPLRYHYLAIC